MPVGRCAPHCDRRQQIPSSSMGEKVFVVLYWTAFKERPIDLNKLKELVEHHAEVRLCLPIQGFIIRAKPLNLWHTDFQPRNSVRCTRIHALIDLGEAGQDRPELGNLKLASFFKSLTAMLTWLARLFCLGTG